jgi:hypothetical protein
VTSFVSCVFITIVCKLKSGDFFLCTRSVCVCSLREGRAGLVCVCFWCKRGEGRGCVSGAREGKDGGGLA